MPAPKTYKATVIVYHWNMHRREYLDRHLLSFCFLTGRVHPLPINKSYDIIPNCLQTLRYAASRLSSSVEVEAPVAVTAGHNPVAEQQSKEKDNG